MNLEANFRAGSFLRIELLNRLLLICIQKLQKVHLIEIDVLYKTFKKLLTFE